MGNEAFPSFESVIPRARDRTATAMGVREDIVMASMDAVLSCMNVLTADYNNKNL
jgi:hypothetical protein